MNSMPEPSNPCTIAVADGHVVYTCCGKVDVEPHRNFCPNYAPAPRIAEGDLREFARRAVGWGFAIDPDGDPSYLTERLNALLAEGVTPTPPESEWAPLPDCPAWCTGKHLDDGQFRDCISEEAFVPQADNTVAVVCVESTFNRATGTSTPVQVRVEDQLFHPHHARHLAVLLTRAADLANA